MKFILAKDKLLIIKNTEYEKKFVFTYVVTIDEFYHNKCSGISHRV